MAKKSVESAENLSDYATDLSKIFDVDLSELFELDNENRQSDKTVQVKKKENRHATRRVLSELALEKELPWHFEQGVSYHCISHGDVDSLTYMRVIVKQQKIKYALVSTWCMASEDIAEIRAWVERGYIGRCDFYVGEIFKASYYKQYQELITLCKELGGRVAICRNHAKIIVLLGEKFDAAIETSAKCQHKPANRAGVYYCRQRACSLVQRFFRRHNFLCT